MLHKEEAFHEQQAEQAMELAAERALELVAEARRSDLVGPGPFDLPPACQLALHFVERKTPVGSMRSS